VQRIRRCARFTSGLMLLVSVTAWTVSAFAECVLLYSTGETVYTVELHPGRMRTMYARYPTPEDGFQCHVAKPERVTLFPKFRCVRRSLASDLSLPLWILALAAAAIFAATFSRSKPAPGHCRKCGYDLTGNVSGRCPECGESAPRRDVPGSRRLPPSEAQGM
jgi:hypothetical protein